MAIQFSDTTNYNGLIQMCEAKIFAGDYGAISGNTKLLKTFTNYINVGLSTFSNRVADSDTRWQWHDSNYTTHPEALTDLVVGQRDYKLSDVHQMVRAVYVKDQNGVEYPLKPTDEYDLVKQGKAPASFLTDNGAPEYFDLKGRALKIYPAAAAANVTTTEGLRVSYVSSPSYFLSTDTTKTAGIPPTFQDYPAEYACMLFAKDNSMEKKAAHYQNRVDRLDMDIQDFYSKRDKTEGTTGMRARHKNYV